MGSHESTVVVRMPEDLKSRLRMEAKKFGMSVSELIRTKLLAMESSDGEQRAVIRLGDRKYELDDILRPDLISYEPAPERRRSKGFSLTLGFEKKRKNGKISDECSALLARAREVAIEFINDAISPEHLLYAMLELPDSNGYRVLEAFTVDVDGMRREIEDLVKREGKSVYIGSMPLTREAEQIVKAADSEVKLLHEEFVGTEHLLMAILRQADSVAATLLVEEGVTYDDVLAIVREK